MIKNLLFLNLFILGSMIFSSCNNDKNENENETETEAEAVVEEEINFEVLKRIASNYDTYTLFQEGLAKVSKDGKVGYVNTEGIEVIPLQYSDGHLCKEGLIAVCNKIYTNATEENDTCDHEDNNIVSSPKWGFIDKNGKVICKMEYDEVHDFSEGYAAVYLKRNDQDSDRGYWGFIAKDGRCKIRINRDCVRDFSEGMAYVEDKYGKGFIDKNLNFIDCSRYSYVSSFKEGLAFAFEQTCDENTPFNDITGNIDFIDKKGNIVFKRKGFTSASNFNEGLAQVSYLRDKEMGYYHTIFVDKNGNDSIDCSYYDEVGNFSEGLAPVKKNDLWGFIDTRGNLVIPCQYKSYSTGMGRWAVRIYPFTDDCCVTDSFVIDKNNNKIIKLKPNQVCSQFRNGICITKFIYGNIYDFYNNDFHEELVGYMDKKGNTTFTDSDYVKMNQFKTKELDFESESYKYDKKL